MNTKGTNRSVLRTQNMLKTGLIELMKTKSIHQISVKELTDYVNLNRGTFYLHYRDIFDLLEHLENELIESFEAIISAHPSDQLHGGPFPLLKDIFELISENADFSCMILGDRKDWNFVNKLIDLLKEKCFHDWACLYSGTDPDRYDIFYSYILSGCIGIIETWLFNGRKQSNDEIAAIAQDFILHGFSALDS